MSESVNSHVPQPKDVQETQVKEWADDSDYVYGI